MSFSFIVTSIRSILDVSDQGELPYYYNHSPLGLPVYRLWYQVELTWSSSFNLGGVSLKDQ